MVNKCVVVGFDYNYEKRRTQDVVVIYFLVYVVMMKLININNVQ